MGLLHWYWDTSMVSIESVKYIRFTDNFHRWKTHRIKCMVTANAFFSTEGLKYYIWYLYNIQWHRRRIKRLHIFVFLIIHLIIPSTSYSIPRLFLDFYFVSILLCGFYTDFSDFKLWVWSSVHNTKWSFVFIIIFGWRCALWNIYDKLSNYTLKIVRKRQG